MENLYVQNLSILLTDNCNFNCAHCMRGPGKGCFISDTTIENIFNQIPMIDNLCFNGGEGFLALNRIEKIIETIIKKEIIIGYYDYLPMALCM